MTANLYIWTRISSPGKERRDIHRQWWDDVYDMPQQRGRWPPERVVPMDEGDASPHMVDHYMREE